MMQAAMQVRWEAVCRELGRGCVTARARLEKHYGEPHRRYHTLQHIRDCLACFDTVRDAADQPAHLEFALWFHDIIYDPRAPDNERRSAETACRFLADPADAHTITALILATGHDTVVKERDAQLIADVDLGVLGSPPAVYDTYAVAIRQEYAWVGDADFAAGRRRVLEHFLAADRLYRHPALRERFEAQARENLRREISGYSS